MLLKSPSDQIVERIADVRYSPLIDGQVTKRNFCHLVAPSTLAASYSSPGIASRPASMISVQNGRLFQMCTSIAIERPSQRSLSQFGPSSAVSRKITELMIPHSGLSMKRNERIVGIDGTAHGRMNST